MDRLSDKALLAVCCFAALVFFSSAATIVVGFLFAVIVAAIGELRGLPRWLQHGCVLLYLCGALFVPAFAFFIPLVIYDLVCSESWILRLVWIPLGVLACRALDLPEVAILCLICVISNLLARRTLRLNISETLRNARRDELQGLALSLEKKNRALKEKQDYEVQVATLGERARIAREIHDNVGHLLTRSALQIEALRVGVKETALDGGLQNIGATINEALDSVRESVHGLHDESFDLCLRLRALAEEEHHFTVALDYRIESVPAKVGYSLVAIAAEALTNAERHSDATRVEIAALEYPAFYQLTVTDNGTRDPFKGDSGPGGIGLKTMEERVHALGGVFKVDYARGVRVFTTIPKEQTETGVTDE